LLAVQYKQYKQYKVSLSLALSLAKQRHAS